LTQVCHHNLTLEEVLRMTEFVILAKPANPPCEDETLKVRIEGDWLEVLLPDGETIARIEKGGPVDWDGIDYQPSRSKFFFEVIKTLKGKIKPKRQEICVLPADWERKIELSVMYEYNRFGPSPIYRSYHSETQQAVEPSGERILFLARDSREPDCFQKTVMGAYEAASEAKRIRKLAKRWK